MKICPICHAGAFDDATVCYGCLHRFDAEPAGCGPGFPGAVPPVFGVEDAAAADGMPAGAAMMRADGAGLPPALVISVQAVPGAESGVGWRCDVDGRSLSVSLPS